MSILIFFPHICLSFLLGNHSVLCNYFIFLCFSLSYSPFIHPFFLLCLYNYLKNHLFRYELVTGEEHLKSRNNETEKLLISHGEKSQKYTLSFSDTKPCQYLFWNHKHLKWTASLPWLGIYLNIELTSKKANLYFISMNIYIDIPIKSIPIISK